METVQNTIIIPQKAMKEIRWHLKNYKTLDEHIENRRKEIREELSDYYHYTNKNYLKSLHGIGSTLEKSIIAMDEDKTINRYMIWKKIINKYVNDIDNQNNYIIYGIIRYFFFDKRDIEFVKERLNLDKYQFKEVIMQIFSDIYQRAIEEKLYKEAI